MNLIQEVLGEGYAALLICIMTGKSPDKALKAVRPSDTAYERMRWNEDVYRRVERLKAEGLTWREIGEKLAVSAGTCSASYSAWKRRGQPKKVRELKWSEELLADAKGMKDDGATWKDVYRCFNIPPEDERSFRSALYTRGVSRDHKLIKWDEDALARVKELRAKGYTWEDITKLYPGSTINSLISGYNRHRRERAEYILEDERLLWEGCYKKIGELKAQGLTWDSIGKMMERDGDDVRIIWNTLRKEKKE